MESDDWPSVADLQARSWLLVEDGNHGESRPRPDEFAKEGVAFIRAADMNDGAVLFSSCEWINSTARARIRKGIGMAHDILLSHKGTVGKLARVGATPPPFVCSPQTTFYRVLDCERIDRDYLYSFMRSSGFSSQLKRVQDETDMAPYVSLTAQRRLRIAVPEIGYQRAIGSTIRVLDDKIELNRRMTETLEAMARAIFKSWFVDFEPVRAKAVGRLTGLPAETSELFPDNFGDDGLPVGWRPAVLGGLFDIRGGNTPSTEQADFWGGSHEWATPKDLSLLQSPVLLTTGRQLTDAGLGQCSSGLLPEGSLLLSTRAPIGYLAFTTRPTAINQGFAGFVKRRISTSYAWSWCGAHMTEIIAHSNGSTFQEISKSTLRQMPMLLPSEGAMDAYCRIADRIVARITLAAREAQTLAALRDTLLPKLISGDLRIADAERLAGAA
jgi:type I restriction enzyme S subunit